MQIPELSNVLQLSETATHFPWELNVHLDEHYVQICLFQSQTLHPKSEGWAVFELE